MGTGSNFRCAKIEPVPIFRWAEIVPVPIFRVGEPYTVTERERIFPDLIE
jgi:hypothetical protein